MVCKGCPVTLCTFFLKMYCSLGQDNIFYTIVNRHGSEVNIKLYNSPMFRFALSTVKPNNLT